ncbi:MAG: chemotaxis protein CheW, partial [Acidobacteriota bacterium]
PCAPAEAGAAPILVQFEVASGAPLPAARAMVALKRLQTLGTVSKCEPDPSSWADKGLAGKVRVTLQSGMAADAIAKEIGGLPDIRACEAGRADASRAAAAGAPRPVASTLRVRTDVLDRLMDGVGDLLVASALVEQSLPRTAGTNPATRRLRRAISRLHDDVLEMRMVAFDWIAQRFHQSVRHLAQNLGKKARMEISGADVRMDRAMLEELIDPINHMLRNAIDHGLEEPEARAAAGKSPHGSIRLALEREGEVVRIRLSDDGRGMDTRVIREAAVRKGFVTEDQVRAMSEDEALMLTTIPGFSTAEKLSEVSGRGVGMDVVRTRIESLGGHMRIESHMGQGTRIEMQLPLTVAVIDSLLLRLGPDLYAVPIHSVQQTLEVKPEQVQYSAGRAILQWGERTVHLRALRSILGEGDAGEWERTCPAVIYEVDGHTFGLGVDSVIGKRPIVVKPLKHPLENLREYSGATVLESGRIALILDLANLAAI